MNKNEICSTYFYVVKKCKNLLSICTVVSETNRANRRTDKARVHFVHCAQRTHKQPHRKLILKYEQIVSVYDSGAVPHNQLESTCNIVAFT
jgi:hypothetical protein